MLALWAGQSWVLQEATSVPATAAKLAFQVINADGSPGPRKDTAIVFPMQQLEVALDADNPGIWMLHCHNTYHQEAGMMTSLNHVP